MNILDRTLVIKSYLPPEDTKVLWIDMSTDPKNAKIWNANNARWESVISNAADVDLYLKEVKDALRKKAGVMGNPTDNSSTYSGTLEYENKPFFPHTKDSNILVTGKGTLDKELLKLISSEEQNLNDKAKKQARDNIEAVGAIVYEDGTIELTYKGNTIQPSTTTDYVKVGEGNLTEELNKINTKISSNGNDIKDLEDTLHEVDERSAETKERVDIFLKDADTSEKAKDTLLELQSYIEEDKSGATQMLQSITENKRDIQNEVSRATQKENELENNKANTLGDYPNLTVGHAYNLVGRDESINREFVFSSSGGKNKNIEDGTARINSIKGNSVVYNQLVNNIVSSDLGTTGWYVRQGNDKAVISGNKITITFTSGTSNQPLLGQRLSLKSNRKYYIKITYEVPKLDSNNRALRVSLDQVYSASSNYEVIDALNGYNNTKQTVSTICSGVDEKPYLIITPRNFTNDVGEKMSCEVEVTDLTKMFNGVNVPATVEEFESLYGNMPNEHNEGTIIDNHTSAIKSVGVNAWDEEITFATIGIESGNVVSNPERIASKNFCACIGGAKYYVSKPTEVDLNLLWYDKDKNFISFNYCYGAKEFIAPTNARFFKINLYKTYGTTYKHDICIHLVHTGYLNGRYFPYESQTRQLPTVEGGLKSAGTAYDEIRYNKSKDKWEHVKRIGSVDLGTLRWYTSTNSAGVTRFISTSLLPNCAKSDFNKVPNILNHKYLSVSAGTWYNNTDATKTMIGLGENTISGTTGESVIIIDMSYTDTTTFKQAMQGVILNYELAEPVVTELDFNRDFKYNVWDFGTEEAISNVLSTPFKANITYGFNAVDTIRWNEENIDHLYEETGVLHEEINELKNPDNFTNLIEVTYDELVSLRNDSKLKPGCWYRITDYVTTTSQENTQSAGHQFDVLVLATDVNVLSEEARAIQHGGEDIIMYGTNYTDVPEMSNVYQLLPTNESFPASDGKTYWIYDCFAYGVKVNDVTLVTLNNPPQYGEPIGATEDLSTVDFESMPLTIGDEITANSDYFYNSNLNTWKLWYCLDNDTDRFDWATNGTGVIYRMIDEYGNDCPYDFKNILFNNFFTFGRNVDFTMISANRSILNTIESSYLNNKRVLPVVTFESTSNNTRVDNNVFYINVRGIGNSNVIGTTILYGVSGTYNNILEIEIPNNNLPMKVAKNSNGEIKIYNEVDLVQ